METVKPQKILVVDDEEQICYVLREYLRDQGYEVEIAHSGETALQKVEEFQPDIVFLDIKMPGVNGIEVLKEFKKKFRYMKVYMITGYEDVQLATECLRAGAADFIKKPFNFQYIHRILES